MAIKVVSHSPNIEAIEYTADASISFTAGGLLYRDTSTGEIKEATSSAGTTLNVEAIGLKTFTSASSSPVIRALPIHQGMYVVADCTANTAADQLNKAHAMTDAFTVNNSSSHVATTLGVFVALKTVGAASDKKLYGYFVKVGQVTA